MPRGGDSVLGRGQIGHIMTMHSFWVSLLLDRAEKECFVVVVVFFRFHALGGVWCWGVVM